MLMPVLECQDMDWKLPRAARTRRTPPFSRHWTDQADTALLSSLIQAELIFVSEFVTIHRCYTLSLTDS